MGDRSERRRYEGGRLVSASMHLRVDEWRMIRLALLRASVADGVRQDEGLLMVELARELNRVCGVGVFGE